MQPACASQCESIKKNVAQNTPGLGRHASSSPSLLAPHRRHHRRLARDHDHGASGSQHSTTSPARLRETTPTIARTRRTSPSSSPCCPAGGVRDGAVHQGPAALSESTSCLLDNLAVMYRDVSVTNDTSAIVMGFSCYLRYQLNKPIDIAGLAQPPSPPPTADEHPAGRSSTSTSREITFGLYHLVPVVLGFGTNVSISPGSKFYMYRMLFYPD